MKIMVTSFKRSYADTAALSAPTLQQVTADPHLHRRLLESRGRVSVSLLWGRGSFLLGPGVHEVLFVPSKSLFPQSWVSLVALCGVNGDLLQERLCHTQVCWTQSPCPCSRPLLTCTSAGDTQTLKGRSGSVSVGSHGVQTVLFEPSERLWWVWGLILNVILSLLQFCWGFSFALGCGLSFFGGIQHSAVNSCSAASCNFGVLSGESEYTSFYSTILCFVLYQLSYQGSLKAVLMGT